MGIRDGSFSHFSEGKERENGNQGRFEITEKVGAQNRPD